MQADQTGKYFKLVDDNNIPADSAIERFEQSIAFDAIAAHEDQPTYDDFVNVNDPKYFVGREVRPLDGRHPGRVDQTRNLKGKGLSREERRVWTIKYYRDTLGEGKAKKKVQCTKEELLPLLVIRDEANPGAEDLENGNSDEDPTSGDEDEFNDGEDDNGDGDNGGDADADDGEP